MINTHQSHSKHRLRFYIVMITIILAGISIIFFFSDDNSFGLSSAVIGGENTLNGNDGLITSFGDELKEDGSNQNVETIRKLSNKVDITLAFDNLPSFYENAKVSKMELQFSDPKATISVNNDKLELSNLNEISLSIENFMGTIDFKNSEISLKGKARKLSVNDVTLSSDKDLDISVDYLDYNYLHIDDIELRNVDLSKGDGELTVGNKLRYTLEEDEVVISSFKGEMTVDKNGNKTLVLEGVSQGQISASGELLSFNMG